MSVFNEQIIINRILSVDIWQLKCQHRQANTNKLKIMLLYTSYQMNIEWAELCILLCLNTYNIVLK